VFNISLNVMVNLTVCVMITDSDGICIFIYEDVGIYLADFAKLNISVNS